MSDWLYPLSRTSGRILVDEEENNLGDTSFGSFKKMMRSSVSDDWWYLSTNFRNVSNGDRVWIFNEMGELIISKLSPRGFDEISRTKLIERTKGQQPSRDKGVAWSHPAFANRHVFIRNDDELVCASLAAK